MKTISKVWRDSIDRLAMGNNHHAPNRYSKVSLIKYNICKQSGWESPWVKSYFPLSISTATSWTKETRKTPLFHDKQLQKYSKSTAAIAKIAYGTLLAEKNMWAMADVGRVPFLWQEIVKMAATWWLSVNCLHCSILIPNYWNLGGLC